MGQSVTEVEHPWPMCLPFTLFSCLSKVRVRKFATCRSLEDCVGTDFSSCQNCMFDNFKGLLSMVPVCSPAQHKKEKSHLGIVSLGAYQYCFVGDVEPQQVEQVDFDTDQASSDLW